MEGSRGTEGAWGCLLARRVQELTRGRLGQSPGRRSWEPEMLAVLRTAILKMSLWERGATYGSSLQNLKYRNERRHQDGCMLTRCALITP